MMNFNYDKAISLCSPTQQDVMVEEDPVDVERRLVKSEIELLKQTVEDGTTQFKTSQETVQYHTTQLRISQETVQDLTTQVNTNKETVQDLTIQLKASQETIQDLSTQVKTNQETVDNITTQLQASQETVQDLTTQTKVSQKTVEDLTTQFEASQEQATANTKAQEFKTNALNGKIAVLSKMLMTFLNEQGEVDKAADKLHASLDSDTRLRLAGSTSINERKEMLEKLEAIENIGSSETKSE
uniref:Uncharacterized protein n=1 Tax=Proboscia inermis TaxID=420281 RepID=A0A7S0GD26_9STRA|mmetsp:Transcript_26143/g.26544  ORF Transcript_26143/g.26544 Transcript_26143/m.26544 type:complete len:242 (+) Transcript_26143:93-818(+)|eukprot:CAMPEP_0171309428 /NCGR_PEP_ID=MMETSP0816-20121228/19591_1 /TAXON_ID=420281 /ORGANISM="Proboscia inermis, Strain CCAP1064/1" /LENGTH=241 /DNA_ID=CAMNT_0011792949 /DNA_START=76 /DNA_END=801 /DNA_ORIENTATION=-